MKVKVAQSCPTLHDPMVCSLPGSSVHGILQARILEWVAVPFFRGSSRPGDRTRSPALRADSLPSEPPEKPKNAVVGRRSSSRGSSWPRNWTIALHCRILYQLSYQGWNALCFLCEKFCLVPYKCWEWTICWTHRWYQKAPVLGCGLLIDLHKHVGHLSGFFFCVRTWKSLASFCGHCAWFSSSHPVYNTCPREVEGKWKSWPCFFLS